MMGLAAGDVTSPWWATPVIAGCFVIGGAGVALISSWLSDRRRAKREDETRWRSDLREVSARFLTTMQEIFDPEDKAPTDRDLQRLFMIQIELEMIAPKVVSELAMLLVREVRQQMPEHRDPRLPYPTAAWLDSLERSFVGAVQTALGVKLGQGLTIRRLEDLPRQEQDAIMFEYRARVEDGELEDPSGPLRDA